MEHKVFLDELREEGYRIVKRHSDEMPTGNTIDVYLGKVQKLEEGLKALDKHFVDRRNAYVLENENNEGFDSTQLDEDVKVVLEEVFDKLKRDNFQTVSR